MISVFGKTRQVATELQHLVDVLLLGRDQADLSDPVAFAQAIRDLVPPAVINTTAYTTVDKAEEDEELATIINGDTPNAIEQQLQDDPLKSETYHYSGAPSVSWSDFASEIFAQVSRSFTVTSITTVEYPTPDKRPLNSRMDCRTTVNIYGVKQPNWRIGLNEILKELEVTA
jgi:dTDP-4-dehydrorhamnose reductase